MRVSLTWLKSLQARDPPEMKIAHRIQAAPRALREIDESVPHSIDDASRFALFQLSCTDILTGTSQRATTEAAAIGYFTHYSTYDDCCKPGEWFTHAAHARLNAAVKRSSDGDIKWQLPSR